MSDDALAIVARGDKDRYLSLMFCPPACRVKLAALYAFDLELEKIRRQVSEQQIGLIRLQWWRETLDEVWAGGAAQHPLAAALAEFRTEVPLAALEAMISAAEQAMLSERLETMTALEEWLGKSSSMVIQAAGQILGGSAPTCAGLAGVAFGLVRRLHAGERWFIPQALLEGHTEQEATLLLADHALRRLAEARKLPVPAKLLPAFLPATTVSLYARSIRRNPLHPAAVLPLFRQFVVWRSASRDRF